MTPRKQNEDLGEAEVLEHTEQEVEKGLLGDEVDQTPNAHYSVAGVLAGKSTPETESSS
jgi:hypothetical protein